MKTTSARLPLFAALLMVVLAMLILVNSRSGVMEKEERAMTVADTVELIATPQPTKANDDNERIDDNPPSSHRVEVKRPVFDIPRTNKYNDIKDKLLMPNKKYLLYQPSGGLNNQRIILSIAMLLSNLLNNRTLLVSPVYKHTSHWRHAWNLNADSLIRADRVFDFDSIRACLRSRDAVALEESVGPTIARLRREEKFSIVLNGKRGAKAGQARNGTTKEDGDAEGREEASPSKRRTWRKFFTEDAHDKSSISGGLLDLSRIESKLSRELEDVDLVEFGGGIMWQIHLAEKHRARRGEVQPAKQSSTTTTSDEDEDGNDEDRHQAAIAQNQSPLDKMEACLRYDAGLRGTARRLITASLSSPTYNAVHIRRGDFGVVYPNEEFFKNPDDYFYRQIVTEKKFEPDRDLYIATEPSARMDITKIQRTFKSIKYSKDLDRSILKEEFHSRFDSRVQVQLKNDILGTIEQLICVCAYKFVGTPGGLMMSSNLACKLTPTQSRRFLATYEK